MKDGHLHRKGTSTMLHAVAQALMMAFAMFWAILWALILGFGLSAIVQAVVSNGEISRLLPDDSPRSLGLALALGAASSSCSYAAVALTRALFRKGANFTAAIAFELASTNLVLELGIILAVLMGWRFTLAEFLGAPLMVVFLVLLFRAFLHPQQVEVARRQADRGVAGSMEGHAAMDMSVSEQGTLWQRISSPAGFTAISQYFVMDWAAVWRDIGGGLLIAGALAAWVPQQFWQAFFLVSHPRLAVYWGPLVGPLVAVLSFVCSVGNVPLAAVLWNGGSSFGGVIAFLFADLIIVPILNIYRKYYGGRMSLFLFATMYIAMAVAALGIEFLFRLLHLMPTTHAVRLVNSGISWNYTSILNIVFLGLATLLVLRFFRTGGAPMLGMMGGMPSSAGSQPAHGGAEAHSS